MLSFSLFSVLFDRSIYIFFPMLLEHILFFLMTPLSFCKITRREISFTLDYLFFVDGCHVLRNSRFRS
jgi:hypothetical protein